MLFDMMPKRPVGDQLRSRCPDGAHSSAGSRYRFSVSATTHSKIQAHRSAVGPMGNPADSLAIRSSQASLHMLLIGIRLS